MQQSSYTTFADDEHVQLAQCRRRRERHHSRPRFVQLETHKEGFRQGAPNESTYVCE